MNKRFSEQYQKFIYKNQRTPLSLGTLCVVMLCLLGLIVATFTQIDLYHLWFKTSAQGTIEPFLKHYPYIPQIPILLATIAILGTRFSILTLFFYVLIGFFLWPIFALGGGLMYIKSTFFGYILGYFPAAIIAGNIFLRGKNVKNILFASLFAVFTIHICGILYSMILAMFHLVDFSSAATSVVVMTGTKICYDWIVSIIAIMVSIPVKYILWLAMDTGVVKKPKQIVYKKTQQN